MHRLSCFFLLSLCIQAEKLNVILIIADDLNERINPYGDFTVDTPNINRLAANGVTFKKSICQLPYCSPSRTSMLSGLYPWTTGTNWGHPEASIIFPSRPNIFQIMRMNSYNVHSYGKVRHIKASRESVFQEFIRPSEGAGDSPLILDHTFPNNWILQVRDGNKNIFQDYKIAELAQDRIQQNITEKKPFFLSVGFETPHDPYIIPSSIWDKTTKLENLLPEEPEMSRWSWVNIVNNRPFYPFNDEELKLLRRAYYSEVLMLDEVVGEILTAMDENNLWENTMIVFASDHGFSLGEHYAVYSKSNATKESINSPLIIVHPDAEKGSVYNQSVELVDIFPTILESSDLMFEHPITQDGESLLKYIKDTSQVREKAAFSCVGSDRRYPTDIFTRVIQKDGWKLVDHGGSLRLFNMDLDPNQWKNLLHYDNTTEHQTIAQELHSQLLQEIPKGQLYYGGKTNTEGFIADIDFDSVPDEVEACLHEFEFQKGQNDSAAWNIITNHVDEIAHEALIDTIDNSGLSLILDFKDPNFKSQILTHNGRIGMKTTSIQSEVSPRIIKSSKIAENIVPLQDSDSDGMSDSLETELSSLGFNSSVRQVDLVQAMFKSSKILYWHSYPVAEATDFPLWKPIGPSESDDMGSYFENAYYGYPYNSNSIIFPNIPLDNKKYFFKIGGEE